MVDRSEATAGRPGWVLIENEGALFRGFGRGHPQEVWAPRHGWKRYAGAGEYKPIEWGDIITEDEMFARMVNWEATDRKRHPGE